MSVVVVVAIVTVLVTVDNILGPRTPTRRMEGITNKSKMQNMRFTDAEAKAIGVVPVVPQNI